jgi:hypothetical protein
VTEKESAQLALSNSHSEVNLYPDLFQDSVKAVSVPLDSVMRSTGPSRDSGNYLKLEISPAGD